jgi:hypothetical protein
MAALPSRERGPDADTTCTDMLYHAYGPCPPKCAAEHGENYNSDKFTGYRNDGHPLSPLFWHELKITGDRIPPCIWTCTNNSLRHAPTSCTFCIFGNRAFVHAFLVIVAVPVVRRIVFSQYTSCHIRFCICCGGVGGCTCGFGCFIFVARFDFFRCCGGCRGFKISLSRWQRLQILSSSLSLYSFLSLSWWSSWCLCFTNCLICFGAN